MTRLPPAARTEQLLNAALDLATRTGWRALTHDAIAEAASVSRGLVVARLGTMDQVRRSVMRAAVRQRCARVVAEGLACRDKQAMRADDALRAAAAEWVRGAPR